MPYINVRITDEQVTKEQKQEIIEGCTRLMVDILDKDPKTTFVVIDEVSLENWGIGFDMVSDIRLKQQTSRKANV